MKRLPVRLFLFTLSLSLLCIMAVCSSVTALNSWAAVSPEALPEDMRDLVIEDRYIPSPFPTVGTIHSLRGAVVVVHRADRKAYLGSEGDPIHENDEFYTLPDSRCRLRFVNEDVISLGADTRFSVDAYISQEDTSEKTSIFSMVKGKAMFYAMRLFKYRQARFQVKTPTAVMGVRGTQFGAHVYWMDEKSADTRGVQVVDSGRTIGPYLAQAGGRGTSVTEVGVGDGDVGVNGVTLGPGETYNSYTGKVTFNPGWLAGLAGDTDGDNGDGEGEGEGEEGSGDDFGDDNGDLGDMGDTTSNITSTQTGSGVAGDASGSGDEKHDLTQYRYFASMLKKDSGSGTFSIDRTFLTKTASEMGSDTEHRAGRLDGGDGDLVWKDGRYISVVDHNEDIRSISVTTTSTTHSSGYDYLAFGKWEHAGTFVLDSGEYQFVNYAWWLEGDATPDSVIASQKGNFTYSGEAYGTMAWDKADDIVYTEQMSGSFETMVNFDTASVQDFNMSVASNPTASAQISGAGGSIAPDGTFSLSGGTWSMSWDGSSAGSVSGEGYGRFFGPKAEEIGGNWAMIGDWAGVDSQDLHAVGVFGGKR